MTTRSQPYLDQLLALTSSEAGWGYTEHQQPHLEPTCLALLAANGSADIDETTVTDAKALLARQRGEDGLYRLQRGRPEATWATSLAIFTSAVLGESDENLRTSGEALLSIPLRTTEHVDDKDINDIDGSLRGWPWAMDNFSWVEPTSWACLALRRIGQGNHPRVQEGRRLLLDRILPDGGINYGNRNILGLALEPIPTTTALMLLALQGDNDERIDKSVAYLCSLAEGEADLEHLAWACLALDVYRHQPGAEQALRLLLDRIDFAWTERSDTPWVSPSPVRLALSCLALSVEERNPFLLEEKSTAEPLPVGEIRRPGTSLGERISGWFRGLAINVSNKLRPVEPTSPVHIAPVTDYNADLADVLQRQYENFRAKVPLAGKRVVLKPNLVEYHRDKVINTNPNVVAAAIELAKREGAEEVLVAEGPGHWRNVEYLVSASGLGDVLRHYNVRFVDLNHDEPIQRTNMARLTGLDSIYLSQTIATADVVISMPKLKTHHWAVATLSMKNLFGTLPGICYGWPKNELHWRGIDNSIVDITATRTPDLAIVDGILGMEGDGPLNGTVKEMGVLVMGADLVAVDATCCRLMCLDPTKVAYLVMGANKRIGNLAEARIHQLGETLAERAKPFETVDHFKNLQMKVG